LATFLMWSAILIFFGFILNYLESRFPSTLKGQREQMRKIKARTKEINSMAKKINKLGNSRSTPYQSEPDFPIIRPATNTTRNKPIKINITITPKNKSSSLPDPGLESFLKFLDGTNKNSSYRLKEPREPANSEETKNLAVKSGLMIGVAPLEKILRGEKTWEMRRSKTTKRETIGLIGVGTGRIFGIADIIEVKGPLSKHDMENSIHLHQISQDRLNSAQIEKYKFAWVLRNVRSLTSSIPYKHKPGAVIFVNFDQEINDKIKASLPN
jgi:hypothetical protein